MESERERKKRRITHNTFKGHRRGRVVRLELYKYRRCRVGFKEDLFWHWVYPRLLYYYSSRRLLCLTTGTLSLSSHGKHTHTHPTKQYTHTHMYVVCVFNLDLMEWDCCRAAFKRNLDPSAAAHRSWLTFLPFCFSVELDILRFSIDCVQV